MKHLSFCPDPFNYKRRKTREVRVGTLGIGGDHPIRVQSMTTTDTMDVEATVAQSERMIAVGCELVRITAPSKREAERLKDIAAALRAKGHLTPLVADIHFTPNAAEIAAEFVEKVRVNPGNYADKKRFENLEYTDETYAAELDRIREKFTPLVRKCKALGRAMRIGTNHGSLSDRIMSRYGDTPLGMVESALEFLRICVEEDYLNVVVSMKSSNALVMVQAYRLLVARMNEEGMDFPLHLGVTEAGDGEDGRVKSALGIGTLLEDGLGDTIRVSLTEEPEAEMPVGQLLVERYANRNGHAPLPPVNTSWDPFNHTRRHSHEVGGVGGKQVPVVVHTMREGEIEPSTLFGAGYRYSVPLDKWNMDDAACDWLYTGNRALTFDIPGTLQVLMDAPAWTALQHVPPRHHPLWNTDSWLASCPDPEPGVIHWVRITRDSLNEALRQSVQDRTDVIWLVDTDHPHAMADLRACVMSLDALGLEGPAVLRRTWTHMDEERLTLEAATDLGGPMLDGFGDGLWIDAPAVALKKRNALSFGILQAARMRISKTEYISCPSCGRTLFDLQETTAKIRAVTHHLKGVKIGIMGCIVNGPGEMADADYGYVGTGPGKITLYKEKEVVRRNVPESEAVEALIDLIREHGDWVEATAPAEEV
ncbi:MAG: 4-hydroxy-3-methylbut-2-en-yl diphosphate synthase [Bacteroidota bacterium]|jgi:(E)-4-hydroxy-3-methylbut-2-enyl-diphosphate synthase